MRRVELGRRRDRVPDRRRQEGEQRAQQLGAGQRLDPVLVQPDELARVRLRGRAVDLLEIEQLADLVAREHLLIAVGPADAREPAEHGLRQIALRAVVLDRHGIASLRELLAAGPDDQRNVREQRRRLLQRLVERELEGRVAVVVRAADHVADAHVEVVDHDREVVERRAVAAADDHVADLAHVLAALAIHQVVPRELPLATGAAAAPCGGRSRRPAPARGSGRRRSTSAGRDRRLTARLDLLGRADAAVGAVLARAAPRSRRRGARGARSGGRAPRPSRCRASRGRRRSPPRTRGSSAPRRCPRCAAASVRRRGG